MFNFTLSDNKENPIFAKGASGGALSCTLSKSAVKKVSRHIADVGISIIIQKLHWKAPDLLRRHGCLRYGFLNKL